MCRVGSETLHTHSPHMVVHRVSKSVRRTISVFQYLSVTSQAQQRCHRKQNMEEISDV